MAERAIEFTDYHQFPLEPIPGPVPGLSQRVISRDKRGRIVARVLEYAPGVDTTPMG